MQLPLIFIHIPKTAGTSFRKSAEHCFGSQHVLYDYGEQSPETSLLVQQYVYRTHSPQDLTAASEAIACVAGHFSIKAYRNIFPHSPLITFVREPIHRLLSDYNHFVNHYGYRGSFKSFYSRTDFINRQAKLLDYPRTPLSHFDFIGFTEDYATSLREFHSKFGIHIPISRLNLGRYMHKISDLCSPCELEWLRELNAVDIELYTEALRLRSIINTSPRHFINRNFKTAFGGHREGKLVGWAVNHSCSISIDLAVRDTQGSTIYATQADRFRLDVYKAGLHPSGHGGFVIPLEKLNKAKGSQILRIVAQNGLFDVVSHVMI